MNVVGPYTCDNVPNSWFDMCGTSRTINYSYFWFAIYEKDEVVAAGAWKKDGYKNGYLGPSFVKPNSRGKGYQKVLINTRLEHATSLEIEFMNSCCYRTNEISINNLLKSGFVVISREEAHKQYFEGLDIVYLTKKLQNETKD